MQEQTPTPYSWVEHLITALEWPVVVGFAFWLGRKYNALETRVVRAETHLTALIERHLPHIHNALAEIKGLLQGRR